MFDSIGVATTNGTGSRFNRLKSCDKRLIAVCVAILIICNENMIGKSKKLSIRHMIRLLVPTYWALCLLDAAACTDVTPYARDL